jgi:hypothetical protein
MFYVSGIGLLTALVLEVSSGARLHRHWRKLQVRQRKGLGLDVKSVENAVAGITPRASTFIMSCLTSICCVTTERLNMSVLLKARGLSNSGLSIVSSSDQCLSDRQYRRARRKLCIQASGQLRLYSFLCLRHPQHLINLCVVAGMPVVVFM